MKKQFGGALMVFSVLLVLIVSIVGFVIMNYVTYYNKGNVYENQISATWNNNTNILGQYSLKVVEAAKVSDKYANDVTELMRVSLSSRYGEEGSGAMMQWITEQNNSLDPALYTKIQQIIESGRNEFQNNQTILIDQCRYYKQDLGYLWSGFWYRITGYPKGGMEALEKTCKPIISGHAKKSFDTGIDEGVNF